MEQVANTTNEISLHDKVVVLTASNEVLTQKNAELTAKNEKLAASNKGILLFNTVSPTNSLIHSPTQLGIIVDAKNQFQEWINSETINLNSTLKKRKDQIEADERAKVHEEMDKKDNELKNWKDKKDKWKDLERKYKLELNEKDNTINRYSGQVQQLQDNLQVGLNNRTIQLSYAANPDKYVNIATEQLTTTYRQALAVKDEEIKKLNAKLSELNSKVSSLQSSSKFIYLCSRLTFFPIDEKLHEQYKKEERDKKGAYVRLEPLLQIEKKLDSTAIALHQRHDVLLNNFCGLELPYDWGLIIVIDTNIVHHWNQVPGTARVEVKYGNFSSILGKITVLIREKKCPCKVFIPFTVERELGNQKDARNGHPKQASAQSIFTMYTDGNLFHNTNALF